MSGHANKLQDLGITIPNALGIHRVLQPLPPSYKNFVMNYNMSCMNKTLPELFSMLKNAEVDIKKQHQVLMVNKTTSFKKKGKSKEKGNFKKGGKKASAPPKKPKDGPKPDTVCFYCKGDGQWKRNCSKYLADMKSGNIKKKDIFDITTRKVLILNVKFSSGLLERTIFDLYLPEFDKPWVIHLRETCCCSTNLCSWRPNTVYKNRSAVDIKLFSGTVAGEVRNPTKEIFSELDEINAQYLIFPEASRAPKRGQRGRGPHPTRRRGQGAPYGVAAPGLLRGCPSAYKVSENPKEISHDTRKVPSRRHREAKIRGQKSRSGTLPDGELPRKASSSTPPPSPSTCLP
ncbi:hypothetical protein QYE76_022513 [Lolium multiflorum]|uniref:Uncharacterized protein n=1 Tax=Lolium multiflorum TaxID=4521 RepID=A0AAD8R9Y4_LOLMU|nr:hypothetical protein QYE76_022513 [Lolium multiflorum]